MVGCERRLEGLELQRRHELPAVRGEHLHRVLAQESILLLELGLAIAGVTRAVCARRSRAAMVTSQVSDRTGEATTSTREAHRNSC